MEQQKAGKLNQLQRLLPEGLVVDAAWLERHGYSSPLRSKYAASGWLEQVTRGVYCRPGGTITDDGNDGRLRWQAVVISLQTLLERPLVAGGRTALEQQGFAHYLTSGGAREVHLYGGAPPPGWIKKLPLETQFVFHNSNRLFREESIGLGSDPIHHGFVQQPWGHWEWPLTLSTPERAILELLDEVPRHETFHQADVLMEGLRTLSPRRLQRLLVNCRSVKVKRLFLWFAARHNHAWVKRLDREGIDLGSGKRVLVRGGKLDPQFQITVPENFDGGG